MYYVTTSARTMCGSFQTMSVIWRKAALAAGHTISASTANWRAAITALDPTGETPGAWQYLVQAANDDRSSEVNAASVYCDATVILSDHGKIVRSFRVNDTTQTGLASAITAKALQIFGLSIPAANVYISNITINVKGGLNNG